MCGKQCTRPQLVVQMLYHRPCDCQAIIGTCSTTNLVQNNQAMLRGMMQDGRSLFHLHHKRTLARGDIVLRTNTRKDAIYQTNTSFTRWHKAAELGQEGN